MKQLHSIIITFCSIWILVSEGFHFEQQQWKNYSINSQPRLPYHVQLDFAVIQLDHSNPLDNRVFELCYLYNEDNYKPGGPIFLLIGGQEPLYPVMLTNGPWYEIAKEHGAFLVYPELRYAGLSRPFKSLTVENLKYNTIGQSVDDLVELLQVIKVKKPELKDAKVILAGAGYGGNIATYFRARYPKLSQGTWISSAPLEALPDETQIREEVGKNIRAVAGVGCYERIRLGFEETERLVNLHQTEKLVELWRLCGELDSTNTNDVSLFMHTLYTYYFKLALAPVSYIQKRCAIIINTKDNVQALVNGVKDYLEPVSCIDTRYEETAKTLSDPNNQSDSRPFLYTVCNEMGQWSSGDAKNQPFGTLPKLDFYIKLCNDVFHLNMTWNNYKFVTHSTNLIFGGKVQKSTNIYFTHGTRDPNRVLGMDFPMNPTSPVEYLSGEGFASELYYFAYPPSEVTISAQLRARDLIYKWLQ